MNETLGSINPLFGDTAGYASLLGDAPPEIPAGIVSDDHAPISDVSAAELLAVLEPTPADKPATKPADSVVATATASQDWDALAEEVKVDSAALQREALLAFKKLVSKDMSEREHAIAELAKAAGVKISGESAKPTGYVDKSEIATLRGELEQLKAQTLATENKRAQAEITKFATTHADFETLRPEISKVLQAGLATDLADAYAKVKAMKGESVAKPTHVKPSASAQAKPAKSSNMFDGDVMSLRKQMSDVLRGKN